MSEELTHARTQLEGKTKDELVESTVQWFGTAVDMRDQRDELALDLEMALNICRNYQRVMSTLDVPDQDIPRLRSLLHKYGMEFEQTPKQSFRVFVDGVDITLYPDSIPGDAEELHLSSDEYYGIETVELVQLEDGTMGFRPGSPPPVEPEDVTWEPEDEVTGEVMPVETRDWLIEEVDAQTERINAQRDRDE